MSAIPRIIVGPGISIKRSLKVALSVDGPPFLLTYRAYTHVRAECGGSDKAAWRWLGQRAKYGSRPLFVNVENPDGTSHTIALAPRGWSPEKRKGYVGGLDETLEAEFGEVSRIWNPDEVAS
jgi:hypothetical protein